MAANALLTLVKILLQSVEGEAIFSVFSGHVIPAARFDDRVEVKCSAEVYYVDTCFHISYAERNNDDEFIGCVRCISRISGTSRPIRGYHSFSLYYSYSIGSKKVFLNGGYSPEFMDTPFVIVCPSCTSEEAYFVSRPLSVKSLSSVNGSSPEGSHDTVFVHMTSRSQVVSMICAPSVVCDGLPNFQRRHHVYCYWP